MYTLLSLSNKCILSNLKLKKINKNKNKIADLELGLGLSKGYLDFIFSRTS